MRFLRLRCPPAYGYLERRVETLNPKLKDLGLRTCGVKAPGLQGGKVRSCGVLRTLARVLLNLSRNTL